MPEGNNNLSRLFESDQVPVEKDPRIAVNHRYDFNLGHIRKELDEHEPNDGILSLSYRLAHFWPDVSLEEAAGAIFPIGHGNFENPYSSGHSNIAYLFLNPQTPKNLGIFGIDGWILPLPQAYENKPEIAFGTYLDAVDELVNGFIAEDKGELVFKDMFYRGPDVGLSLVGSGDALLKVADADPENSEAYFALAERSYQSSGFEKT